MPGLCLCLCLACAWCLVHVTGSGPGPSDPGLCLACACAWCLAWCVCPAPWPGPASWLPGPARLARSLARPGFLASWPGPAGHSLNTRLSRKHLAHSSCTLDERMDANVHMFQ